MENNLLNKTDGAIYFKKATEYIKKHTIQIFVADDKEILLPFATGVLVVLNNEYFIITANHAIKDVDLMIKLEEYPTVIKQVASISVLDIAIIKLNEVLAHKLKIEFAFLKFDKIKTFPTYNLDKGLITSGYPKSYQKSRRSFECLEIKTNIVHINLVLAEEKQYETYNINKNEAILLNYPEKFKDIENDILKQFPNPKGLSGSGLWKVYADENLEPICYLVGIMVEFDKKFTNHIFIAHRIEHLIELITTNED